MVAKKKLKKVTEVGFIPGIYNYCDRWCEKCELRLHCMSFVMGKKLEEKGGFNFDREINREEESIWSRLKDVFESTYEVLHELAEERGIEVEDIYASENINKEFWGEDFENRSRGERCNAQVENSDIVKICMIYEDLADKSLEKIFEYLNTRNKNGNWMDDALEVVNWYLDLIQAKMRRALYGLYYQQESDVQESEDYNGSAKVALLAVDRSIESWKQIQQNCPDYKREIEHLLVVLEQLKADVEAQFPNAREFKRPGFEKPGC